MRYGLNKQDGVELRKTEDAFQFNSTLGYRKDTPTGIILQNSISIRSSQMVTPIQIRKFPFRPLPPIFSSASVLNIPQKER
jgi:hypothetical protein